MNHNLGVNRTALSRSAKTKRAERSRDALTWPATVDPAKLHRCATQVNHHPVGLRIAEDDTERTKPRFLGATGNPEADSGLALGLGAEVQPVGGVTHGGGGNSGQRPHMQAWRDGGEPPECCNCAELRLRIESAGLSQTRAKAAHDPFVEQDCRTPAVALEYDHAYRIRSDIDHSDAVGRPIEAGKGWRLVGKKVALPVGRSAAAARICSKRWIRQLRAPVPFRRTAHCGSGAVHRLPRCGRVPKARDTS